MYHRALKCVHIPSSKSNVHDNTMTWDHPINQSCFGYEQTFFIHVDEIPITIVLCRVAATMKPTQTVVNSHNQPLLRYRVGLDSSLKIWCILKIFLFYLRCLCAGTLADRLEKYTATRRKRSVYISRNHQPIFIAMIHHYFLCGPNIK